MDVLVVIDEDQGTDVRCRIALALARICGSYIHCLQVTSPNALIASGSFGTARMLAERADEIGRHKEALHAAMQERFAPLGDGWDYRCFDGDLAQTITEQSRLVDLVLLNSVRQPSRLNGAVPGAADLVLRLRPPVMAISELAGPETAAGFMPNGSVLVAWDGSVACAHALRNAVPLLKCAATVVVVTVEGERPGIGGEQVRAYLGRHGIASEVYELPLGDRTVTAVLLAAVRIYHASYLVMGAFGHGRAREFLMGGVTRDMLKRCPVPLVLAH